LITFVPARSTNAFLLKNPSCWKCGTYQTNACSKYTTSGAEDDNHEVTADTLQM
jgi:hypothetical protein